MVLGRRNSVVFGRPSHVWGAKTLLAASALALLACGEAAPPGVSFVPQPIVGGEVDVEHQSVFALFAHQDGIGSSCTATLIAPNLLLTARHCISPTEDEEVICGSAAFGAPYPPGNVYASNAVHVDLSTRWFRGDALYVPSEGDDTCGFDVALIVLSENVPVEMAEPAIPRIDQEVERGETYVAVGYGRDDDGSFGGRMVRRDLEVACTPGSCGRLAPGSEFVGDTGVCRGDSGGPALDANGKVVGVVSRGGENCSVPIYGTVTAWKDFLTTVAFEAAERGAYPAPFWATSGTSEPPPPPIAEPGAPCGAGIECSEGHTCYQSAPGAAALCTAQCSAEQACAEGTCRSVEEGARALCLPEETRREPELEPTCSFAAPRPGAAGIPLAVLGLLLAGFRGRRFSRGRKQRSPRRS